MSHGKHFLMGVIVCLGLQGQGSLKPDSAPPREEKKKETYITPLLLRGEPKKMHRFNGQSQLPPFMEREEEE